MSEGPSHKHKRPRPETSDTEDTAQAPTIHSPLFWFSDGSVILQGGTTQFRVHTSMLALHSTIFRDLFQVPQPSGQETVEGCPIVHLSETANDVSYMLSALYERNKRPRPAPFSFVSAMLRTGRKYEIKHILDEAVEILESALPSTLLAYQSLRAGSDKHGVIVYSADILIDIVNLALAMNRCSILPAAYLLLCDEIDAVMKGAIREDQSIAKIDEIAKEAIILGREKLLKDTPVKTFSWVKTTGFSCYNPKKSCIPAVHDIMADIWRNNAQKVLCFVPIEGFLHDGRPCNFCQENMTQIHQEQQRKMWNELPVYFGLASWEAVRGS